MTNPLSAYLKIARIAVLLAAVIGGVWYAHHRFEQWRHSLYADGYSAGQTDTNLLWQTASSKAVQAELENAIVDAAQSRTAVSTYLQTIQDLIPKLQSLGQQRITYVSSKAGAAPCLDADGMQLIRVQRKALGLDAGADPAAHTAGPAAP